jgi:hypothetical protein
MLYYSHSEACFSNPLPYAPINFGANYLRKNTRALDKLFAQQYSLQKIKQGLKHKA